MKNADMPAMPVKGGMVFFLPESGSTNEEIKSQIEETIQKEYHGLTKRELFAAMAMQGMLAGGDMAVGDYLSEYAVDEADALLDALESK